MSKPQRRREKRNSKRDLARRKRQLGGPTAWAREILHRRLTREAARESAAREQAKADALRAQEARATTRHAAYQERQQKINAAIAALVQQEHARAEREALRDHEHSIRDADEPMTLVQWSPTSGRQ
jgi:hypothetical protein